MASGNRDCKTPGSGGDDFLRKFDDRRKHTAHFAGANSIFYGECLLTTPNPDAHRDLQLFKRLGLRPEQRIEEDDSSQAAHLQQKIQNHQDNQKFYDASH